MCWIYHVTFIAVFVVATDISSVSKHSGVLSELKIDGFIETS